MRLRTRHLEKCWFGCCEKVCIAMKEMFRICTVFRILYNERTSTVKPTLILYQTKINKSLYKYRIITQLLTITFLPGLLILGGSSFRVYDVITTKIAPFAAAAAHEGSFNTRLSHGTIKRFRIRRVTRYCWSCSKFCGRI